MEKRLTPPLFAIAAFISLTALLSASILLPHDRYHRYQAHNDVTTRKADWIYERLHFDSTPIDVALIGTSRMAGGLSGPKIEADYCAATGRKIHVANLAIPVTGRNMHFVIAKEAARLKAPALTVIELNDIESRRPHSGFIFLADATDVLSAPLAININYVSDLLRLPGRQAELFLQGLLGKPAIRQAFDPEAYAGAHLDRTERIVSIDGRVKSRDVKRGKVEMDALYAARLKGVSPLYILPKSLRILEYRFSRIYLRKAENAVAQKGGEVAYAYLPAYRAESMPEPLVTELAIDKPTIDLGGASASDPGLWLDATHFNADGAALASQRFAKALADFYPALGAEGCR